MKQQTTDIFSDFERIQERMEQAWRQVLGPPGAPRFSSPLIEPSVDVYETDDEVVVVAEIAGISQSLVSKTINNKRPGSAVREALAGLGCKPAWLKKSK